jgi:hypothetical protein
MTLESAYVAEVKRRTAMLMLRHFEDIRDFISINHFDVPLDGVERVQMRKVYELVLQKIKIAENGDELASQDQAVQRLRALIADHLPREEKTT